MKRSHLVLFVLLSAGLAALAAVPPAFMDYKGVLRDGSGNPRNGSFDMVFRFYDSSSSMTLLLTDTHDSSAPSGQVSVSNGLFTAQLGKGTITAGSEPNLAEMFRDNAAVWLEVQVGSETLTPRARIIGSAYAQNASSIRGEVNVDGSGSVGIGTSYPSAALDIQTAVRMFGDVPIVNCGSSATAASDGFLFGWADASANGARGYMIAKTNDIQRASASAHYWEESDVHVYHNSFLMPVRKGETYSLDCYKTAGSMGFAALWIPLGHAPDLFTGSAPPDTSPTTQEAGERTGRGYPVQGRSLTGRDGVRGGQPPSLVQSMPVRTPVDRGDVLIFDPEDGGGLRPCSLQVDPMVIGVASEDGPCPPVSGYSALPVAVAGVTSVKADATLYPIANGDLLVASSNTGHAMKASKPFEPGTIVGKALEPLENGTGMIKILVMLR